MKQNSTTPRPTVTPSMFAVAVVIVTVLTVAAITDVWNGATVIPILILTAVFLTLGTLRLTAVPRKETS